MLDSRSPWYSVGASRTDLEASSSHSLLHSIYGSQASQLLYSDYDSETSLHGTRSTEYVPPNRTRSQRALNRPKSSPASVIAARDEQRRKFSVSSVSESPRPPANRRARPSTAAVASRSTGIARARPISAIGRQQRPSTAVAGYRGGATRARSIRPASAMGIRGSRGSLTQLVDLEEEQEPVPVVRDTPPVHLTRTPEYVYFWEGKPLQQRDFSVKPQKRRAWQRPKSDYGNRFLNKQKSNMGDDGGTGGGLETLVEKEDSTLGSDTGTRRGSKDFGLLDHDGKHGKGDGDDRLKGSRRGSKDSDDGKRRNRHGRSRDGSRDGDRKKKSGFDRDKWAKKKGTTTRGDQDQDASTQADDDEFFKKNDGASEKEPWLPSIPSNRNLCAFDQEPTKTIAVDTNKENRSHDSHHDLNMRNRRLSLDQNRNILKSPLKESQNELKIPTSPRKLLSSMSWMDGSGSSNSTRFELPMDMKQLEGMAPLQYLRKHCIVSNRRMAHCSKVFTKLDKDKDTQINQQELKEGLLEALHHCITINQAEDVLKLALISDDMLVDVRLFAALCCLAERALNLFFLPLARKEVIEMVDFEALDWKLRDCTITPSLQALFAQL